MVNPCLSGGALEIFLEPLLPPPLLHVVGHVADRRRAGRRWPPASASSCERAADAGPDGATAAVVATPRGDEVGADPAALDAGVGFVGLVCSRTRGAALLDELADRGGAPPGCTPPVGLDIGARTAPEIALSILAEVVRAIRVDGLAASGAVAGAAARPQAVDPVCGMTVTVGPDTPHAAVDGVDHWFCGTGCRTRFLERTRERVPSSVVVLAAGGSRRLGRPKQLLDLPRRHRCSTPPLDDRPGTPGSTRWSCALGGAADDGRPNAST